MFSYKSLFGGFSVNDLEKAKAFYGDTLGVKVSNNEMGMLVLHISNDSQVIVYPKPNHEPASFTILNFQVDNIEKAVDDLTQAGVTFEQYDFGDFKTNEKGIMYGNGRGPDIAWFKDPAGNILSVLNG